MARVPKRAGRNEALTGYVILGVATLFAVWLLVVQARFNPAVIVAMNHPKGAGRLVAVQQSPDSAIVRILAEAGQDGQAAAGHAQEDGLTGCGIRRACGILLRRNPFRTKSTARPNCIWPPLFRRWPVVRSRSRMPA